MTTATMEEVQAHLPELLEKLHGDEELVITRNGKPVAHLTGGVPKGTMVLGRGQGLLISYVEDDERLSDSGE